MRLTYGTMCNDWDILGANLLRSALPAVRDGLHVIYESSSAPVGLNALLDRMEGDVGVILHQDVLLSASWDVLVAEQLEKLNGWAVAGVWGVDENENFVGNIRDVRLPSALCGGKLPARGIALDEICLIVNLHSGLRFDTAMKGFDLYGSYACLWAKKQGKEAWILNAPVYHNTTRSFDWMPDKVFMENWRWLHSRFPQQKVKSTSYTEEGF